MLQGGGHTGQAGAMVHGIAKALILFDSEIEQYLRLKSLILEILDQLREKNLDVEKLEEAFNSRKDNSFLILNCYNKIMPKLNVLVAGSTGYIGVQLIKLLVKHNDVKIKYLCGNTSAV